MASTEQTKKRHPIIILDYIPRLTGQVIVCVICILTLMGQGRALLIPAILGIIQGLFWPNLVLFLSLRSSNPKKFEFRMLFLDSFFVGLWIAYLNFSIWPTFALVCATFMANMAVQGLRLGLQSIFANLLGAAVTIAFYGFHFQPYTDLVTAYLCALFVTVFSGVTGYMTFYRARATKFTREKLKKAYKELDQINKVLKEASASLELDNVMKIIFQSLREVFKFDFITIQIPSLDDSKLEFKAVYGEFISPPAREELYRIRIEHNNNNCLSAQAFTEKQPVYLNEAEEQSKLSSVDQKIQNILWFSSAMMVPILIKNKAIAVIGFYGRHSMEIDEKTLDSIKFYITQVSLIINNALLYNQIKHSQHEIYSKNKQLADLSEQLSKYLSPQIVKRIMQGEKASVVGAERKRLTIFFSDIVGFTNLSDQIESEELTTILNSYLDKMTTIALKFGGTVDKYVGDAIMIFFGDPETRGVKMDAINCARMAVTMRDEIESLKSAWEALGMAQHLQVRMGINTGYCAVGNFGSDYRMEYTVIGSHVNLASRLQSTAKPGEILVSYETYLLVKDEVKCEEGENVMVKGIATPVQTYKIVE